MRFSRRQTLAPFVIAAVLAVATLGAHAREAVVTTKDNRVFAGELIQETDTQVILQIAGAAFPISRHDIISFEVKRPVDEEYRQRRSLLSDDDRDGRYKLAYWLFKTTKAYDLAMRELNDLATRFPDDSRIESLARLVEERRKLQKSSPARNVAPKPGPQGSTPVSTTPELGADGLPSRKLSEEQINLIRVFEIDLSVQPVIQIPRDIIDEFLQRFGAQDPELRGEDNRRRFRAAKGYRQLGEMFKIVSQYPGVRSLYKQVSVKRDPPALNTFRTKVHRNYVLNYCATSGCHGGREAGKLFLFRKKPNRVETVYTNFYILDSFRSTHRHDMIDRHEPSNSLLIQFGLPRVDSLASHPEVPGWSPRLRPRRDRLAAMIVRWIEQLQPHRPNYTIQYKIPDLSKPKSTPDNGVGRLSKRDQKTQATESP